MEESSLHTFEGWLYHNRIALHNDVIAQQNDLRKGKILKLVPRKKKKVYKMKLLGIHFVN